MIRLFVLAVFLPVVASAQVEKAADVRVSAGSVSGPSALGAAPSLSLTAPSLLAAPMAAPAVSPALTAVPAPAAAAMAPALLAAPAPAAPAAVPTAIAPARAATMRAGPAAARDASSAHVSLSRLAAPSAEGVDSGRLAFDGQTSRADAPALTAGRAAASDGPRLSRPSAPDAAPKAPAIPLGQRAGETAELGVMAAGFHLLTGIGFLILGAHAAFPLLAGAFWAFAGAELIKQLGNLRSVVVGGWQASHDQKYRVDPSTGRMKDIRGRKYGEDRYDERAPGPVSPRERLVTDVAAFALGLPWVVAAGPQAVALYAAGAAAVFAARRYLRSRRPAEATARRTNFEYDR